MAHQTVSHPGLLQMRPSAAVPPSSSQVPPLKPIYDPSQGTRCYKCPVKNCGRSLDDEAQAQKHMEMHTGGKYKHFCPLCGKGFSCSANMKGHIAARHMDIKHFKCGLCGQGYPYKASLVRHWKANSLCKQHAIDTGENFKH